MEGTPTKPVGVNCLAYLFNLTTIIMKTHFVTKDGIEEWLKTTTKEWAAHHGNGYNKSLQVTLSGEWIVMNYREEIYRGDIDTAIDTYNSIIPKR